MSLFGRLLSGSPLRGDVTWRELDHESFGSSGLSLPVAAGVRVSPERAEQLTVVSACIKVIAETTATTPIHIYREVASGKERAPDTPQARILRRRPNRWQTSLAFREMMTGHAALRGVAYAEMVGSTMENLELIPRHPDRVQVIAHDDAGFAQLYNVTSALSATPRRVPASRMFVLCGPWGGRSPVQVHREAIGLGLAMQEYASRFFGNGSQPSGLLKTPQGVTFTDEQRKLAKESWERAHRGPQQAHRVAVLEGGLEWQQVGLSAEDSQLLQSRQMTIPDTCRIWSVPPYKVQDYGRATWGNTEQMAIDFLTSCMLPWFKRWEEAIQWFLIDDDEPLYAEFLIDALLRADTATRFAAYAIATGGKPWMAPNEVRDRENLNRRAGLDDVAPVAQGAAPGGAPARPKAPPADAADDTTDGEGTDGERGARADVDAVWGAWARGVADSLLRVELRELENVKSLAERDPAAYADYLRGWQSDKYRATVRRCLDPMQGVWRGALALDLTVATILATGFEWATTTRDADARKTMLLAILTKGASYALAA